MNNLGQLLASYLPMALPEAAAKVRISDMTQDSREVRAGSLFVALRGATHHGLGFLPQACEQVRQRSCGNLQMESRRRACLLISPACRCRILPHAPD